MCIPPIQKPNEVKDEWINNITNILDKNYENYKKVRKMARDLSFY